MLLFCYCAGFVLGHQESLDKSIVSIIIAILTLKLERARGQDLHEGVCRRDLAMKNSIPVHYTVYSAVLVELIVTRHTPY